MTESEALYTDIAQLVGTIGLKLVDLTVSRHKRSVQVSAVVYAPAGTGIDECARAHRLMQPFLAERLGTEDYHLEVASPGIDRVLKHGHEYAAFAGRGMRLLLEGGERVEGILVSSDGAAALLRTPSGERSLPLASIIKAKLDSSQEGR